MSNKIKAGVIGHPIAHSKSPMIHRYWLEKCGIDGEYDAYDISPENLDSEVARLVGSGIAGFNVTVPHKQAVMDLCSEIDETAKEIGAVNTVVVNEDGSLSGRNTDAFGFVHNLKENVSAYDFSSGAAMVLGAGGASRAIVYALLKEGAPEVIIANRTIEKAEALAANCYDPDRIKVVSWDGRNEEIGNASLLINTTSAGMSGMPALDIDMENLSTGCVTYDIVYSPLLTDFLKKSIMRGNAAVNGIGMLLHQARPAFASWFGIMPEVTQELSDMVLR